MEEDPPRHFPRCQLHSPFFIARHDLPSDSVLKKEINLKILQVWFSNRQKNQESSPKVNCIRRLFFLWDFGLGQLTSLHFILSYEAGQGLGIMSNKLNFLICNTRTTIFFHVFIIVVFLLNHFFEGARRNYLNTTFHDATLFDVGKPYSVKMANHVSRKTKIFNNWFKCCTSLVSLRNL